MMVSTPAPANPRQGCWWACSGPNGTPPCLQKCPEHYWHDAWRSQRIHGQPARYYGWRHGRQLRDSLGLPKSTKTVFALSAITLGVVSWLAWRA